MTSTPQKITRLNPGEVFVFGSNGGGRHGRGAAKDALKFGARHGQGTGLMGQSYGIATKDRNLKVLPLSAIYVQVSRFLRFAASNPDLTFLVTEIGCGLAGYKAKEIGRLFYLDGELPPNVVLPASFQAQKPGFLTVHAKT